MVPPQASAAHPPHLTLVRPPATLRRDDIEGLATVLLDLASGYEGALRTVICMQRLLERVRRSEDVSPESVLLLQELSRQCLALADSRAATSLRVDDIVERLRATRGDPVPSAEAFLPPSV